MDTQSNSKQKSTSSGKRRLSSDSSSTEIKITELSTNSGGSAKAVPNAVTTTIRNLCAIS